MKGRQLISLNGAELLDVEEQARDAGCSVPQFFRFKCGLSARGIVGQVAREEPSRARRPLLALERRAITVPLEDDERKRLLAQAVEASTTLAQYMRSRCGLMVRNTSLPGADQRVDEEDDAWNRLRRLGLKPEDYFPAEE